MKTLLLSNFLNFNLWLQISGRGKYGNITNPAQEIEVWLNMRISLRRTSWPPLAGLFLIHSSYPVLSAMRTCQRIGCLLTPIHDSSFLLDEISTPFPSSISHPTPLSTMIMQFPCYFVLYPLSLAAPYCTILSSSRSASNRRRISSRKKVLLVESSHKFLAWSQIL